MDMDLRPAKCHRPMRRLMSRGICGETLFHRVLVLVPEPVGLGIVDARRLCLLWPFATLTTFVY